jgi:hypothetical protein
MAGPVTRQDRHGSQAIGVPGPVSATIGPPATRPMTQWVSAAFGFWLRLAAASTHLPSGDQMAEL